MTFKYFSIIRYSSYSNMSFGKEDLQTMIKEVGECKNFGGDTLVDVTTCGIKRDFEFLKKVSEAYTYCMWYRLLSCSHSDRRSQEVRQ